MHQFALDRLQEFCRSRGLAAVLLTSPFNVTWLTGYAPPIQTGPSPFEGGPALAWVVDGAVTLVLADGEAPAALATGAAVEEYVGYTIEQPLAGVDRQAAALQRVLADAGGLTGKIGVELNWLPAALLPGVQRALAKAEIVPIDGSLELLRAVKSAGELDQLRASLALCDAAQIYVRDHVSAGMTELELWGKLKAQIENMVGGRLAVLADLVGGARSGDIGGPPSTYRLQSGDTLILDFVPRFNGYWGDNAGAYFIGEPPAEMRSIYKLVAQTLLRGIDAVKPGVRANAIDELLRNAIRAAGYEPYPHHTGHGIGTT